MKIIAGIKGQRVVVPLVGTAAKVALKLFGPASSTPLFKKRGQQGAQQFDRDTIQDVAHLSVGGHLPHSKDGCEVAAPPTLLHFALECQKTGVLKDHHGKATEQRVVQAIVNTVRTTRVGNGTKGRRDGVNHGLERQTLSGSHRLSPPLGNVCGERPTLAQERPR